MEVERGHTKLAEVGRTRIPDAFFRPGKGAPERGHTHYVRKMLRDVSQLFNSIDPSPFIERDFYAEEFIVSWAQEFPRDDPIRLHNLPGTVARPEGGGQSWGTQLFCAPRSDCGIGLGGCCEVESNDCRMGDYVAADANLSLRLVACATSQANLREA